MRPPPKVHYLPKNEKVWTPPAVAFIKAITEPIPDSDPEVLRLVGWQARAVYRRDVPAGHPDAKWSAGRTPAELAEWLTAAMRGRDTMWIFTHNAALDIVTSRLPLRLVDLGWEITEAAISGAAPWLRMARNSKHITIVDSFSWLPHTVTDLADHLGKNPPQRFKRETTQSWQARSTRFDLEIACGAMLTLMDWWDQQELGRWSISGPGCGWNAMRHVPTFGRVVIDPTPAGVASDRPAIHGGRRGAWMVGTRSLGPFLELDFVNACPSVAAALPLPIQRTKAFQSMALDNWRLHSDRWGIIAECELVSDVPRWPVRFRGGTFCPVGRFRAYLAGPEIADALRLDCLASIGPGYTHQLGHYLQPWARWILAATHDRSEGVPPETRLVAKAWSRSVIGKWAARSYERVNLGHSPESDWGYTEGWDHDTQQRGSLISLAGAQWWAGPSGDAEQSYPAVLAWVESETRVRLTRVIEALGEGAVLQCDTDGLIVSERALGTKAARGHLLAPKALSGAARTPASRSYAGLPGMAVETSPDRFKYKQMPGL